MRGFVSAVLLCCLGVMAFAQSRPLTIGVADLRYTKQLSTNRGGWSMVTGLCNDLDGPIKTVTTAGTFDTYRIRHVNLTSQTITELRYAYANYAPASFTETFTSGNDLQVQASQQVGGTVVSASNASPIVIKTAEPHHAATGNTEEIRGCLGNPAANGIWTVTVIDAQTLSLQGSTGNGTYLGGGVSSLVTDVDETSGPPRDRILFNGLKLPTIGAGGYLWSDPLPCNIPPGGIWYERCAVTVTVNGNYYPRGLSLQGGTAGQAQNNGEGGNGGANNAWGSSGTVPANEQTYVYSASLIVGRLQDGSIAPSVVVRGDSIGRGLDDTFPGVGGNFKGGWLQRLFGSAYPYASFCFQGEKSGQVYNRANDHVRYALSAYATSVIFQYGRNDLAGGDNLANLKIYALSQAGAYMGRGQRFVACTVLPAPTLTTITTTVTTGVASATQTFPSTTGMVAGQTTLHFQTAATDRLVSSVTSSTVAVLASSVTTTTGEFVSGMIDPTLLANYTKETTDAIRTGYNDWIRDTSATGFAALATAQVSGIAGAGDCKVIDPCALVEVNAAGVLTTDGGYMVAPTLLAGGGTFASPLVAGANGSSTNVVATGTPWTVNQWMGDSVYILGGLDSSTLKGIGTNTTSIITMYNATVHSSQVNNEFLILSGGLNGVHPTWPIYAAIAAGLTASAYIR
jgi:hypothetical protein